MKRFFRWILMKVFRIKVPGLSYYEIDPDDYDPLGIEGDGQDWP